MSEESRKMAKLAVEALDDKKAEDIKVIDISKVSVIADYFIIAGGNNSSQIQALCDNVEEKLGRAGFPARQTEGYETANRRNTSHSRCISNHRSSDSGKKGI